MATQTITTTEIKDGKLTLPASVRTRWKGKREVLLVAEQDRLVVQPLEGEWDRYEAKLRRAGRKLPPRIIDEAVAWARKQSPR